jgi:hypothetical protein
MAMKIILDHKALDKLIGGDTEIEIELRKGVVENFAKHKLSTLFNDEYIQERITVIRNTITSQLSEAIRKFVNEQFGITSFSYKKELSSELRTLLKKEADKLIVKEVKETVSKTINEVHEYLNLTKDRIEELIHNYIDETKKETIQEIVKEILQDIFKNQNTRLNSKTMK